MGRLPKISLFCLFLSLGYNVQFSNGFPQGNSLEENIKAESSSSSVNFNNSESDSASGSVLIPRQEEEEEDDNQQIVQGVGNILTGAFGLDLKKVLKGAFSFADEDVRDNILNVILLGKKPPYSETNPTSPTTTVATTPSSKKVNGTRRANDTSRVTSQEKRPYDPFALVFPPSLPRPTEPPKPKTTTEEDDEGEENDDEELK